MKLTNEQLKQIIKEELEAVLNEEEVNEAKGTEGFKNIKDKEELKKEIADAKEDLKKAKGKDREAKLKKDIEEMEKKLKGM